MEDGEIEDSTVKQALKNGGVDTEAQDTIYYTLLALFILQEAFKENEDEWQLIARKAKEYILSVSQITKPMTIVKKFSLKIKDEQ